MSDNLGKNSPILWGMLAGVSISIASASGYLWKIRNKWTGNTPELKTPPEKWIQVGTVSKVIIYPIKSIEGIEVPEANCTKIGLKVSDVINDRILMLVNEKGQYQSQTQIPKLMTLSLRIEDNVFTIGAPDGQSISFTLPKDTPENRRTNAWIKSDRNLNALDCGDSVAKWFQDVLGKSGLRLYYHQDQNTQRKLDKEQIQYPDFVTSDLGSWQNESPFMLMTEESVAELNRVLPHKHFSIKNFRPTILVKDTLAPFSEINWKYIRIGPNAIMKTARPCPRCRLTTLDQEKGTFDRDADPLTTLVKMQPEIGDYEVRRLMRTQPIMGLRLGLFSPDNEGSLIQVGDPVYVATL